MYYVAATMSPSSARGNVTLEKLLGYDFSLSPLFHFAFLNLLYIVLIFNYLFFVLVL